jgi:pimeloyl-ACP methyl ester carboxylesterase
MVACRQDPGDTQFVHLTVSEGPQAAFRTTRLEGELVTPSLRKPSHAVLLVHGLGGNRQEWMALVDSLRSHDIASLAIDLRGHGESEGAFPREAPDRYGEAVIDVEAGLAWLIDSLGLDPSRIVIVGNSLGGGLGILAGAAQPQIRFIAWYPGLTYTTPDRSLATVAMQRLRGHIIQGSDSTHPRANPVLTRAFLAANPGVSVTWLTGPGHGTNGQRNRYERETLDTLIQWLQPQ